MTLDQLLMFKAVAELGSLRLASEQLHKSQPAISQGIKQLESQLNLVLFSREAYRLTLTEDGKKIFQHSQVLLHEATAIKQLAKHLSTGHEASITIAFDASFNLAMLLPILEATQNEFPNTQIVLKQEYISGAIELLQQDRADIVVSPIDVKQLQVNSLELVLIAKSALIDVAAPKLLLRHPNLNSGADLLNEYQIIVQDSGFGTKDVEFGVQDGQRRWYVNDFLTKKMLIQAGMGWGKLPRYLIEQELQQGILRCLALKDRQNQVDLDYYVIKKKHHLLGTVARHLWQSISLIKLCSRVGQRGSEHHFIANIKPALQKNTRSQYCPIICAALPDKSTNCRAKALSGMMPKPTSLCTNTKSLGDCNTASSSAKISASVLP